MALNCERTFENSIPAVLFSRNNFRQVIHTRVPLFTKQYNLVPDKGLER